MGPTWRCRPVLPRGHHAWKRDQLLRDGDQRDLRHALDLRQGPVLAHVPAASRVLDHLGGKRDGLRTSAEAILRELRQSKPYNRPAAEASGRPINVPIAL